MHRECHDVAQWKGAQDRAARLAVSVRKEECAGSPYLNRQLEAEERRARSLGRHHSASGGSLITAGIADS